MALLKDNPEILMTGEELFRRPDLNPCELVNGRVVPTMPTGDEHGDVELELGAMLRSYGKESKRGRAVGGEVGIYIRRNPDTVRAADLVFISRERDVRPRTKGYFEIAPELVVEILSPDDRVSRVREKLRDYFSAGVLVVWLVDPASRRVLVYRSPTDVKVLDEEQVLADEGLLPGFSVAVADLFSK
ncbi:MAG TPA: Uma2 family endonuclease [Thermoanaerobaculia bacterium]|jgi:Uma2 family endonuclease|nr:Uma2 family endonuclease [Thermoanaerobaculia bacterium]